MVILTADDSTWMLPAWAEAMNFLAKDFSVVGIWVLPNHLGKLRGKAIFSWYLSTFGLKNMLLLGMFAGLAKIRNVLRRQNSWRSIADRHGTELHFTANPNTRELIDWIKNKEIDIGLTSVGNYLKEPLLQSVKIGFINKHAAVLPQAKGIFPYIWSVLESVPLGVTYHKMVPEVDAGPYLLQWERDGSCSTPSMLRFYFEVFARFPAEIAEAAKRLREGKFLSNPNTQMKGTYFSFPERKHIISLEKMGGRIAKGRDIFYILYIWLLRQ
ncbi:MAG: formyltransferase family protein [Bacteriovoracia bacterium]